MCDFDKFEPGTKADQVDRWLRKYRGLKAKEQQLSETIRQKEAEADGLKGIDYSRDNVSTPANDDALMLIVERLDDIRESLTAVRQDALRREMEMEAAIDALPDPMHSAILRGHYINGLRWEMLCSMDETACSYRSMMRWRKAALESIYDLDLIPHMERLPRVPAL